MRGEDGDAPRVDGCHGELGLVVVAELPQGALRGHLAGRVDHGSRSRLAELLDGILGHGVPVRLGEGVVVVPGDEDGHDGGHEHEALDAGLFVGRLEGPLRADDGVTKHGIGVGKVHGDGGCEMGDSVDTLWGCQLCRRSNKFSGLSAGKRTFYRLVKGALGHNVGDNGKLELVGVLGKSVGDGFGRCLGADSASDGVARLEQDFDGDGANVAIGAGDENEALGHGAGIDVAAEDWRLLDDVAGVMCEV